jgi:hypothetical protein
MHSSSLALAQLTSTLLGTAVACALGLAHAQVVREASSATAATTPPPPPGDAEGAAGLLSDVERIVNAQEYDQWFVDTHAYQELLPELMPSVCRSTPAARQYALAVTHAQSRDAGDPRARFAEVGEVTDEVEDALHYQRQHEALSTAVDLAASQCPFWSPPEPGFPGRQTTRRRLVLSLETGGLAQLRIAEGDAHLGGGGAGRLLGAYRWRAGVSLLGGLEFGGGAMVRPGTGASGFVINYLPAVPLVVRFHDVAWHYELETAAVALFQADNTDPSFGVRGGAGVGFSTLRTRDILPWAGATVAVEHYFAGGGRAEAQFIRAGLRLGFLWDPE